MPRDESEIVERDLLTFQWEHLAEYTILILIAYAVSLPLAWNRERHQRSAGLRTFPLVAVASCAFTLLARQMFAGNDVAIARVIAGIVTGIGFVGGGAILKSTDRVRGTATAASIWSTGAVGVAVGYSLIELALLVSAVNLVTFMLLTPLKREREDEYGH